MTQGTRSTASTTRRKARKASTAKAPGASISSLYAHALAIERESVKRYGELSARMARQGQERLAGVFGMLSRFEQGHVAQLLAQTTGMSLPRVEAVEHAWEGAEELEVERSASLSPRRALELALLAEQRARAYYESLAFATRDREVRALSRDLAAEEQLHIEAIQYALDELPR